MCSKSGLNKIFMIFKKMAKFIKIIFFSALLAASNTNVNANTTDFNKWLNDFKIRAKNYGITESTIKITLDKSKYIPKVIEYDRYQPEFYEDTLTYVKKRTSILKIKKGKLLYIKNKKLINDVEKKFSVEKELLLALMGIETNFGTYLGKMDIISSLATLSFDKRRSEFFSKELLTLLKLIDLNTIDHKTLFGSWAGAFGNFQFMPSTIKQYAIDYNKDNLIDLKSSVDSFASAANYINKMGWKNNEPCFYKIELKNNIPDKFLNTSAKNITNKKKLSYFKKFIKDPVNIDFNQNLLTAIVTPDKDIVPNAKKTSPAYLVFNNYELILKWNRSLRFGIAVCTLKESFEDEI
jgi:membrane-bound lytic murein transglycosylase B